MADETKQVADALLGNDKAKESKGGWMIWIILSAVVVAAAAGAGLGAGMFLGKARAPKAAEAAEAPPATSEPASGAHASSGEAKYKYIDLPGLTATLNEDRMSRYVRVVIKLEICEEDYSAANKAIEEKMPGLVSWLQVYLAGCTLEDVRGEKNLNRILRVVRDEFNRRIWPDHKPLIHQALFKSDGIVIQ